MWPCSFADFSLRQCEVFRKIGVHRFSRFNWVTRQATDISLESRDLCIVIISKLRLFKEVQNVFVNLALFASKKSLPDKLSATGAAHIIPAFRHCRLHGDNEGK